MKKKIAVITGAGVSAESELATFRDSGGMWDKYDVNEVASIEGWYRNRKLVLDFYNMRRRELEKAEPNGAHRAIAALEDGYDVKVVTQNVDNLHERAGSTYVLHLHGELTKVRPENTEGTGNETIDIGYSDIGIGDLSPDGVQLRPHIVFFGEAVPNITKAIDIVSAADILLIVGTSLQVYPAAGLYRYAGAEVPIYIIDPKDVPVHDRRITHIRETATKGMEKFRNILESE